MIDPSIRLRRAIHRKDVLLVKRIVHSHPALLRNPDFDDKSNTSLHLAAELGALEIAQFLLDAGHDAAEVSRNTDWETPMMLAITHGHVAAATLLIARCARCITWENKKGQDAVRLFSSSLATSLTRFQLHLSALHPPAAPLIPLLLTHPTHPATPAHRDRAGDTALHAASASGSLRAVRALLDAGADPAARNAALWDPLAYSHTVQAEVFFKQLVAERDGARGGEEHGSPGARRGVRIVGEDAASEGASTPGSGWGSPRRGVGTPGSRGGAGGYFDSGNVVARMRAGSG